MFNWCPFFIFNYVAKCSCTCSELHLLLKFFGIEPLFSGIIALWYFDTWRYYDISRYSDISKYQCIFSPLHSIIIFMPGKAIWGKIIGSGTLGWQMLLLMGHSCFITGAVITQKILWDMADSRRIKEVECLDYLWPFPNKVERRLLMVKNTCLYSRKVRVLPQVPPLQARFPQSFELWTHHCSLPLIVTFLSCYELWITMMAKFSTLYQL